MGIAGAAVLKVLRNANPSVGLRYFWGLMLWQLKQLSCSKCGADRYNCALSRSNWTRAKKRRVKDVRTIWSMICRLNLMNRTAAAKQVNNSRVRHFSRATDLSNAFQNVRWFRRRELRKYSPGGDDI